MKQKNSVAIYFLGDEAFPPQYPTSATNLAYNPDSNSFIWTDYSISGALGSQDPDAASSNQWTNGYRISTVNGKLPPLSIPVVLSK